MKDRRLWTLAILSVLAIGCPHVEYRLEMTPTDDGRMERRITVWVESDGREERCTSEGLNQLRARYPNCLSDPSDIRQTFAGTFATSMPSDAGGAGYLLHVRTSLGSASAYSERFCGSDDLSPAIDRFLAAADRTVDILVGWFESELGEDARFPRLREFIDGEFRRDLKNFGVTLWLGGASDRPLDEGAARITQYFAERGYFEVEELPAILAQLYPCFHGSVPDIATTDILRRVQRLVATRMGVPRDQPIPQSLRFLDDLESASKSLNRYVRSTEEFQAYCQKVREEAATQPLQTQPTQPIEPHPERFISRRLDALTESILDLVDIDLLGFGRRLDHHVEASLSLPVNPVGTNGTWDEPNGKVTWSGNIRHGTTAGHLPTFFYAVWAVPDEDFQKKHFGTVFLEGQDLVEYCLWYKSLGKEHTAQWGRFLVSLNPKNVVQKLENFKFTGRPPLPTTQPAAQIIDAWRASTQPTNPDR